MNTFEEGWLKTGDTAGKYILRLVNIFWMHLICILCTRQWRPYIIILSCISFKVYKDGVYRILGRTSVDIIKTGGYKIRWELKGSG